jgi:hypothetical protein
MVIPLTFGLQLQTNTTVNNNLKMSDKKDKKSTVKKAQPKPKAVKKPEAKPAAKPKASPKVTPKAKKPSLSIDEIKANYKKARRGATAAKKIELLEQFKKDIAAL